MRRLALAALTAATALTLAGCTAQVRTEFDVTSANAASVAATVSFTGEAAGVLAKDPSMRAELAGAFQDRTGATPKISVDEEEVVFSQQLRYSDLATAGDVLGVSSASLTGDSGRATLRVQLSQPRALEAAVREATAKEPDAGPLAETMLRSTDLVVAVTFAGGIDSVSGPSAVRDGKEVTVTRPALGAKAGELVVVGDPTWNWWKWPLGAALLLGFVAATWRRRG